MSKIDNILEAVLNSNVGDIFKRMDDNLVKIEEHTDKTVKALEKMVTPIEQISKAMGGMGTNAASAADKMQALTTALNTIGQGKISDISKISEAVAVLGKDAGSSFDTVNTLAKALNAFSNGETADLKKFVDERGLAELNAAIKMVNEELLKWGENEEDRNIFSKDQEQALVDLRDLMKEIFDLRNKSTQKHEADAAKEAAKQEAKETKALQKAYDDYLKSIKAKRKDDLDTEKREDKERTESKKREIEEMKAAWNAYFAQRDREAKQEADALTRYTQLAKERETLEKNIALTKEKQKQGSVFAPVTKAEEDLLMAVEMRIRNINAEMQALSSSSEAVIKNVQQNRASGQALVDYEKKQLENAQTREKVEAEIAKNKKKAAKEALDESLKELETKREIAKATRNSYDGAMRYSQTARTLEQERKAIDALKTARDRLNTGASDYQTKLQQLNAEIRRHEKNIKEATGAQEQFNQQSQRLGVTMRDLASSFGIVFSVQSLVNFGRKIVETTGYFEMQHRAMQAIIQDTDKANALWDKTVRLAVKSPYKIKDLVTYTKQLSAYRIETDKLYDTTKMLADISSGLGVDMNRLILAYGQVKAANYLRGQELRQFSEAGVNILGELANYFSELQGRAISTGEVFEMVSKRMVKFEDVATVLHRLTEEGGIFFNMQEQQAETIQGQLMNLKDTFDLFMNSVGEKGKGVILGAIKGIRNALEDSEKVLTSMGIALGAVALRFTAIQAAAIRTKILSGEWVSMFGKNLTVIIGKMVAQHLQSKIHHADMKKSIILGKRLAAVEKEIATARAAGATPFAGWATIISAVAVAAGLLVQHIRSAKEEQKKLNEEINRINAESAATTTKSIAQFKELANKIRDVNTSEAERNRLMQKMKQLYGEILPERLRDIDYITKEGNAYDDAIESIKNYYLALRREKQIEATINQSEQAIEDSIEDVAKNIQKNIKKVDELDVPIYNIKTALRKLRDEWDAGKVTLENYQERLTQLLQISAGVPITMESLRKSLGMNSYEGENVYVNLAEPFVNAVDDANKKLKEVTGRTEDFGMEMKKALQADVFDKAIKDMNKGLDNAVASGLIGDSFRDALEFRAKNAEAYFNKAFENFQKGELFNSYNTEQQAAAKTMFETMLGVGDANGQLAKQMATQSAETIADALDGFVKKHNLNKEQIGIVQQYLIGSEDANKEYLENSIKSLENYLNDVRNIENGIYNIPMMLSAEALAQEEKKRDTIFSLKDVFKEMLEYYKKLNAEEKKSGGSGGNKALELLNKQIDAIKNAAKQYDEYKKRYDDTTAFDKTKAAVGDLFKELNISEALANNKDWSEDNFAKSVESWLEKQMLKAGDDGKKAVLKYTSTLAEGFDEKYFKERIEGFKDDVAKALSDYDMFTELEKLGIGKDFASLFFGVNTSDLQQVKDTLEEAAKGLKNKMGDAYNGSEAQKAVQEMNDKITAIEDKEQKERLKKYIKYTEQAMTERARIQVEGLAEIASIEKTFMKEINKAKNEGNEESAKQIEEMMKQAIDASKKATQDKLQKQGWEDFKGTDMYIKLFEDLDNVSTKSIAKMREKLEEMRTAMAESEDPTALKNITEQIDKLDKQMTQRNPLRALIDSIKAVKKMEAEGNTRESVETDYDDTIAKIAEEEAAIEKLQMELYELEHLSQGEIEQKGIGNWNKELAETRELIAERKKNLEVDKQNEKRLGGMKAKYENLTESQKEFSSQWKEGSGIIKGVISSIMDNLAALGGETNNTTEAWGDLLGSIMDIIGIIPMYVMMMTAAGVAVNASLGVIGLIAEAVQLVIALVAGLAKVKDAQIDDQIDSLQSSIDKLSDRYDRLEKQFDKVWNIDRLREYRQELENVTNAQIALTKKQIDAEYDRKSPDRDKIREWEEAIKDLREQLAEDNEKFLQEVGGLGESNYKDAAQEFIDAWYDAFKETGDGLEGLQEHFDEIVANMVKKQAVMRLADALLKPLFEKIDLAADDGTITGAELNAITQLAEDTFPELNEKLKQFFSSLGMFGEQAEGELDGLQKGIQGVTEQTAEIIAAYMNSIRYYVIDNNTKLGQLAVVLQDNTGLVNPMLAELRSIATRADDIYTLLNSWRETSGVPSMRVTIV